MNLTVEKSPVKYATIITFAIEIDAFELAIVRLSPQERALLHAAESDVRISDKLLALAVLARKIEETVMPRSRKDPP